MQLASVSIISADAVDDSRLSTPDKLQLLLIIHNIILYTLYRLRWYWIKLNEKNINTVVYKTRNIVISRSQSPGISEKYPKYPCKEWSMKKMSKNASLLYFT